MSGHEQIDAEIDKIEALSSKAKSSSNITEKKRKVFGYFGTARDTIVDALPGQKKNKPTSEASRTFTLDLSETAEKTLGGLRQELAAAARFLKLEPPLLNEFKATFDIEVTTGTAIWQALDNNRFWEVAQLEAVKYAGDTIAPHHLAQIHSRGVELRKDLVNLANAAHIIQTDLSAEDAKDLEAQITTFVVGVEKEKDKMVNRVQRGSAKYLVGFMEQQLKIEKDIIKYKAGKTGVVMLNLGLIAGHIAHMAGSFGATSPLAVVAIIRLSVEIGQVALKAYIELETIGKQINSFLKVVEAAWLDRKNEASKVQATSMEVLSGVVKGLTKIEVPSLKTVDSLINDYQHKLNILTKSFSDLGAVIGKLRIVLDAYIAILNTYSAEMSDEQKKRLRDLIDASEKSYHALLKTGLGWGGKKQRMDQAAKNMAEWDKKIEGIEKQTASWAKYAEKVTDVATSLGLNVGHAAAEMLEKISEAHELAAELAAAVQDHAGELIDHLQEGLADALSEAADAPFEVATEALLTIKFDGIMPTVLDKLSEVRG